MHDLELTALDDPFLADAIEGTLSEPPAGLAEDLTDLRGKLDRRVTENNRRRGTILLLRRITAAACILMLLCAGYIFLMKHNRPDDVARAKRSPATASSPTADTARATPSPAITSSTAGISKKLSADSSAVAFTPPSRHRAAAAKSMTYSGHKTSLPPTSPSSQFGALKIADTNRNAADYSSINAGVVASQKEVQFKSTPATRILADTTLFANGDARAKSIVTNKDLNAFHANPIVLSGKVVDYQNRPVAGAFLALKGNNGFGTTTDEHGYFNFRLPPRDTTGYLTVSMIGYDKTSLAVNALISDNQLDNVIRLNASPANLDEVVVTGIGIKRKATEFAAPFDSGEKLDTLWKNAAPVIGRQAYLQYLDVAKKRLGVDSTIRGTETMSFSVTRDGKLSEFKIEQSISPAHDAGIFRLVNDGPGWIVLRGKKVRASVTVNF